MISKLYFYGSQNFSVKRSVYMEEAMIVVFIVAFMDPMREIDNSDTKHVPGEKLLSFHKQGKELEHKWSNSLKFYNCCNWPMI